MLAHILEQVDLLCLPILQLHLYILKKRLAGENQALSSPFSPSVQELSMNTSGHRVKDVVSFVLRM